MEKVRASFGVGQDLGSIESRPIAWERVEKVDQVLDSDLSVSLFPPFE
jgi:hypothetical protein